MVMSTAVMLAAARDLRFSIPDGSGHLFRHARRHPRRRARRGAPVGAGRHTDQFGKASAEGAQRRAADCETDVGDAKVAAPQQRHRPLDAPRHHVAVRRLAVGDPELAAEVPGRHVRAAGERLDVQRPRVLPVDPVADPAQPREVAQVLRRGGSVGHLRDRVLGHSPHPTAEGWGRGRRALARGPAVPTGAGPVIDLSPQLTAFLTSAPILASSSAGNFVRAKAVGHMVASSRGAASLKPNVAYLVLNFCAGWKKQTVLPSLAYAGIPYQSLGERAGALALMTAWSRLPMARSDGVISAIFASRALSPSASSVFSSWMRALIAPRSSSVNAVERLLDCGVLLAAFFVSFIGGFLPCES